ncbi:MAG: GTPase domain-containing protein [Burkholderiales bacterium]
MKRAPASIALSLVSHTNAGKTTLARTLLGRDIGEVRDAPHVTEFADEFTMFETAQGETLSLWDTPGFGDSLRLAKRLRESTGTVGWFLSEVWDRWRDRPFWSSQQALRNVRDEADVMLYLVNASEAPEAAGYVQAEMELLAWVGKPVIVLLNQLGAPREAALESAELEQWRRHLAAFAQVKAVLPLDAFARCWVQEGTLLQAVEAALTGDRRALMGRLRAGWETQRLATFEASVASIAGSLARLAGAFEVVPDAGSLRSRLRSVGAAIGVGSSEDSPATLAQKKLAERMAEEVRSNTLELIRLHGLDGQAQAEILSRLATHFETRLRLDEGKAAVWGGLVTGAIAGLKADVLSGGLTLGGGLIAGGLLGALGAAGLARCVNLVRGTDQSWLAWNAESLDAMVDAALLRYLTVAHFGRGRGDWVEGESPPHWKETTDEALAPHRDTLATLWVGRDARDDDLEEAARLSAALKGVVRAAASTSLQLLYPGASALTGRAALGESAQSAGTPSQ